MRKPSYLLALLAAACSSQGSSDLGAASRPVRPPIAARLENLTLVAAEGMAPSLSPDASRVAWTVARFEGIWIAPSAGGPARQLTADPGSGYRFSWSPDGARIAYATREEDGSRRVRVVPTSGGEPATVYTAPPGAPVPFPRFDRAGRLVYVAGDHLAEAGGGPVSAPLPSPRMVVAAEQAGVLVAAGEDGVFSARPDGSDIRPLFREGGFFFDPVVLPSGQAVLVREIRNPGVMLWSADLATGARRELGAYDRACALSQDVLIAETSEDDGLRITRTGLFALLSDGSASAPIAVPAGLLPHKVECAQGMARIAFGDEASGRVYVADLAVEVAR